MEHAILGFVRGAIALYLLSSMIVDIDKVARATRSFCRLIRRKSEAPALMPPAPVVNYIAGVVLPAPHDPRWFERESGVYRFGSEIEVRNYRVYVRADQKDANIAMELVSGEEAERYWRAIGTAMAQFTKQLAVERTAGAQLGPALTDDEWKTLERRFL